MAINKIFIPQLRPRSYAFPDPRNAQNDGLLAWGGDLSSKRLLEAYRCGIFPWFNENDPILWWSPNPRLLLNPHEIKISKSLKRSMKHFTLTHDKAFEAVMRLCGETRKNSWINEALINAFARLHKEGVAHSVECWFEDELVGGLYGLKLGRVFCGESMFSTKTDASKAALVALCEKMGMIEGSFIDCQLPTEHLKSLGAYEVSREVFLSMLEQALKQ